MIRSREAGGHATLWPWRPLPADVLLSLAAVGVRPGTWRGAHGFALVACRRDGSRTTIRVPVGADLQRARARAAGLLPFEGCPVCAARAVAPGDVVAVDLYTAVAVGAGDRVLWRRLERLDAPTRPHRRDWFVAKDGRRRPLDIGEQEDAAIAALADRLVAARAEWSESEMSAFYRRIESVDWPVATEREREAAWAAALSLFRGADVRALLSEWGPAVAEEASAWAGVTRAALHDSLLPSIGLELSGPDKTAVDAVGDQAGLFVRDRLGVESAWLTTHGREVVARGLRDGLGREAIAADLRAELPAMWTRYGENYSRVVASNAMVRARSISQAGAYRDAGIERYEIMAVMDERTTVICQGLNGQIITVASGAAVTERAAAARDVDELRAANPFVRERLTDEGRRVLQTTLGVDLMYVEEDGTFDRVLANDELATGGGIGFPPYHMGAVVEGTSVRTEHGDRPVGDVDLGDLVWTHRGRWRPVYAVMSRQWRGEVIEVHTDSGGVLLVTDEHPVLTTVGWKAARDLHVGDVVFQHGQEHPGACEERDGVHPEDFPPLIDEEAVAYEVVRSALPAPVILPVDLDGNPVERERDVDDVPAEGRLPLERDAVRREERAQEGLADPGVPGVVGGHALGAAGRCGGIAHRVGAPHPLGVREMDRAVFLRPPERPVLGAARVDGGIGAREAGGGHPLPNGDPVPGTPVVQRGVPQPEIPLDPTEGLAPPPVSVSDEGHDGRAVREVDRTGWRHATIISVSPVRYIGIVRNLAVLEDESFLSDGVVVHNCRTTTVPA